MCNTFEHWRTLPFSQAALDAIAYARLQLERNTPASIPVSVSSEEAGNIARAVVDFNRHKYWFSDGICERLAEAACGKSVEQAADAMELLLATERRVPLNDDPHDGVDPRLVKA